MRADRNRARGGGAEGDDPRAGGASKVPYLRILDGSPGEESALDASALYRRYAPYVAAIGIRILGRDDELDDLVQDAFMGALRGLRDVRDPAAIKGWLARITVRLAVRRLRQRRLRRLLHLDQDVADYDSLAAPGATAEERILIARVYRILDGLAAGDRAVWVLRYVEGEKLERIVDLCGCSLSTAQRRLRRAQAAVDRGLRS
jgi:RNA polymerase sigma-70 factor (ECF subfamily)